MIESEKETTAWVRDWVTGGSFGISFVRTVPRGEMMAARVDNTWRCEADVDVDPEGNIMGVTIFWPPGRGELERLREGLRDLGHRVPDASFIVKAILDGTYQPVGRVSPDA